MSHSPDGASLVLAVVEASENLAAEHDKIRRGCGDWLRLEMAAVNYAAAILAARTHAPELLAQQNPRSGLH